MRARAVSFLGVGGMGGIFFCFAKVLPGPLPPTCLVTTKAPDLTRKEVECGKKG